MQTKRNLQGGEDQGTTVRHATEQATWTPIAIANMVTLTILLIVVTKCAESQKERGMVKNGKMK